MMYPITSESFFKYANNLAHTLEEITEEKDFMNLAISIQHLMRNTKTKHQLNLSIKDISIDTLNYLEKCEIFDL